MEELTVNPNKRIFSWQTQPALTVFHCKHEFSQRKEH